MATLNNELSHEQVEQRFPEAYAAIPTALRIRDAVGFYLLGDVIHAVVDMRGEYLWTRAFREGEWKIVDGKRIDGR